MNATRPWCLSLALALTFASPAPAEVQFRTEIGFPVFGPPFGISDVTADFDGDVYIGLPNNPSNNIHKFDPFGQDLGGFATGPAGVVGLTPDASGLIYASHGNRIAQYLNSGQPLEPNFVTSDVLGQGKLATDKFGNFYVSPPRSSPGAQEPNWKLTPAGNVSAEFGLADGLSIAVDRDEIVHVLNQGNVVRKYTSAGNDIDTIPLGLSDVRATSLGVDPLNGEMFVAFENIPTSQWSIARLSRLGAVRDVLLRDNLGSEFGPITALRVDGVGNLYVATLSGGIVGVHQNASLSIYDRIVETQELQTLTDEFIAAAHADDFPDYDFFDAFVRQASRTRQGLNAIAETRQSLSGYREYAAALELTGGEGGSQAELDRRSGALETINGILTQYAASPASEQESAIRLEGGWGDPFFGRYFTDAQIGFPLPSHVDFTLDPASAVTNITKPDAVGGRVQPRVLSSTIGVDIVGADLRVTDITFEFASFDVGGQPTGVNHGFLPPGAQVRAQLTGSFSFEGHGEGWIVNDLYPANRPLFTFVDLQGYFFAVLGRNDATVYGVNEPIIVPGLPGGPPTQLAGEAFAATRAQFDAATGRLSFHENTDMSLAPDVSVILTPTDVFAHAVGAGEALVGAKLEISPLEFEGAGSQGSWLFADATFELRNSQGIFARGLLTDVFIDADSRAFTAAISFDDVPDSLASDFVDAWKASPARLELLNPAATLQLLAATDDFTVNGQTYTSFIRLATVPEPAGWLLLAIALPLVTRSLAKASWRAPLRSPQRLLSIGAFAGALLGAAAGRAQPVFSSITSFDESITFNDPDAQENGQGFDTPESISVDVARLRTTPQGETIEWEIVATVRTNGGVSPMVDIQGQLYANGLSKANGYIRGSATGRVQYGFMVVEKEPPIVFVPAVPVVLETEGHVSATAPMRATVIANIPNQSPIGINSISGPKDFRHRFITPLQPGVERLVRLRAFADFPDLTSLSEGTIEFQAVVDPVIYIDPSFEYSENYELLFSTPNIEAGPAVPEISTAALIAIGAARVECARRRDRRRRSAALSVCHKSPLMTH